jgi:hypothetical protein
MAAERVLTRQEQPGRGQGWTLRRASIVVVQYAADSFGSSNWRAVVCGCRQRREQSMVKALVVSLVVIVLDEFSDSPSQVALTE